MKQLETHITPTNKHDSSDLSLDLADLVNANVSFESEAESGSVNDVTSESENETVENNSDSDHEAGDALFYPSLSNQRHQKVLDILKEENSQSVLDLGCNSLKFLSLVKNIPGICYMAGVDVDREIMMERPWIVSAPVCRWLEERPDDFLSELWHGDVTDSDSAIILQARVEVVTSIELIEHLDMSLLDKFSDTVLGVIKPKLWIVTTPNRDYNELFPDWPGPEARRHWDHKFEWSREEFKLWIEEVVKKYPEYANVKIDGVGFHQKQEFHESHGPASQIVIFRSSVERSFQVPQYDPDLFSSSDTAWERVASSFLPKKIDPRDRSQKILDEVQFHATCLARDQMMKKMTEEPFETPESVVVPFEYILLFESVKKLNTNIAEIKSISLNAGLECFGDGILINFKENTDSESFDVCDLD